LRKKAKIFIIYFPVILVSCQVLVNLLSFITPAAYNRAGFYLNTFFGTNAMFSVFLLAFVYWFKFCAVSRYAAWAEVLFAVNFMIVQQDNLYNIMFQVIVGTIAILLTFRYFVRRFPLCSLALVWRFIKSITKTKSCKKGLDMWERNTYHTIKTVHENRA
jgi:hypothetical protein